MGTRIVRRHNPLAHEFLRILRTAGREVALEQRDPDMGPDARLDVVEYASDLGGPAAYDALALPWPLALALALAGKL